MESKIHFIPGFLFVSFMCFFLLSTTRASLLDENNRKEFIVYMGDRPKDTTLATVLHNTMVKQVLGRLSTNDILYEFKRSFDGFVVKLNDIEMEIMRKMQGVVSIFPNEVIQLHTTRSWDFMGFPQTVTRAVLESDIIIGVLDTGIWPESESFSDIGMGPPPAKWKGSCGPFLNFTCNNKLIGAKYYKSNGIIDPVDIASPRDSEGHGTHTASTAAGSLVNSASLLGLGLGTARGAVPSSRIAVYKVCWSNGCSYADILAAFDDAIADGVDIISLSVGGSIAQEYFNDGIAIGAFHAMKNGVLSSISAGNAGPNLYTTTNVAPWFLSVAASTIDRKFFTKVQLGNSVSYEGVSVNTFDMGNSMYPMIYGGDIPNIAGGFNSSSSRFCRNNTLDPVAVNGTIVLCDVITTGETVFLDGAAGTVMQSDAPKDRARVFPLPATHIDNTSGSSVFQYIKASEVLHNSTRIQNPTATILKSTERKDTSAPTVVSFSSRGPNNITLDIIKPDITAPGVNILAAWSPIASISVSSDKRMVPYTLLSGTSMSCPHVSGVAAYIKSYNPTWSPAAIKSAIMTTAFTMTGKNPTQGEFAYGSGHVNPLKALQPGLVYDADMTDYVKFLCGQGYSTSMLQSVTGDTSVCSPATSSNNWDLNYPTFAFSTSNTTRLRRIFSRIVTNVGPAISTYKAFISAPQGLTIMAKPAILSFTSAGQKVTFTLIIKGSISANITSGSLVWTDGLHYVRSPIVVFINTP